MSPCSTYIFGWLLGAFGAAATSTMSTSVLWGLRLGEIGFVTKTRHAHGELHVVDEEEGRKMRGVS